MNAAELVRIYEPNPSDEFVVKREAAMVAVATTIANATSVDDLFGYADSLSAGLGETNLSGSLADVCIAELVQASPSFVAEGNDTQIYVCALGACLRLLDDVKPSDRGCSAKEIFSAAVHAGLSLPHASSNAKVNQARQEILRLSAAAFQITGESSRVRKDVPELAVTLDGTESAIVASEKVVATAKPLISALRNNADLDREELELLWFCLGDYSAVLDAKLSSQKAPVGLVASALETTKLLRRLPSTSHVNMALRNVAAGKPKTLKVLVSETEAHRKQFSDYFGDNIASAFPSIVPVTSAIFGYSQPRDTEAREMSEWGRRLILELGLTKFKHLGVI